MLSSYLSILLRPAHSTPPFDQRGCRNRRSCFEKVSLGCGDEPTAHTLPHQKQHDTVRDTPNRMRYDDDFAQMLHPALENQCSYNHEQPEEHVQLGRRLVQVANGLVGGSDRQVSHGVQIRFPEHVHIRKRQNIFLLNGLLTCASVESRASSVDRVITGSDVQHQERVTEAYACLCFNAHGNLDR